MLARLLAMALAGLALAAAGCGSDSQQTGSTGDAGASIPGGADSGDVDVIEGWAEALQAGDTEKAATFWAVPSVASNGTPPLTLKTKEQVVAFNEALPCGAKLVKASTDDAAGTTTATFELTERPGGGCGPGVGGEAATTFKIEDGKIADWRRAPAPAGEPSAPPAPGRIT